MTTVQLSNEFDVLLNSYEAGNIVLDEYEKSIFLTQAQEEVILELYRGTLTTEGFETTEELRRYLSSLIVTHETTEIIQDKGISPNSTFFKLPTMYGNNENRYEGLWVIVHESVDFKDQTCNNSSYVSVYPITHDEYHKIKNNPFRGDSKNRVLRIDSSLNTVELISKMPILKYRIRYLKKPEAIRLIDFSSSGVSIDNNTTTKQCTLHPMLERVVLKRAVALAIASRITKTKE